MGKWLHSFGTHVEYSCIVRRAEGNGAETKASSRAAAERAAGQELLTDCRKKKGWGHTTMAIINRFVKEEAGQDIVEYGILVAGIAAVAVLATVFFKEAASTLWSKVNVQITSVNP
jgi:Flp pilus assembly pilin Flp